MKLSLVIPCYNEEDNVQPMYELVVKTFKQCGYAYEIIFVNDGSSDGTYTRLKELHAQAQVKVKVVSLSRNFGKEAAIFAGLKESRGDYVSLIDADLQQDPSLVKEMVRRLDANEDIDCVTAFQEERHESKALRFFKSGFYRLMNRLTEIEFKDGASDFRTMRRNMVDAILQMTEYYRFSKGIFSWVGFNNQYIPYIANARAAGKSKWSFRQLFKYAIDGIVGFTTAPLRIATVIGLLSSLCSVLYMVIVVIQKLFFDTAVSGYATIVVLILLIGGLQLFGLGMIGEYLGRTYVESKRRPIYIARKVLDYQPTDKNANAPTTIDDCDEKTKEHHHP